VPEAGGVITVSVSDGQGGRQSLLSETVYEVQAPKGGVVTLEYQDIRLTADWVRADTKTKQVVAEGDVVLEQGTTRLKGLRLEMDLTEKTGILTDGSAELAGILVRGATIAKTGARTFEIRDGSVTACEGDDPAWEFRVKDGAVTLDDYAKLKSVVFRLGGVPLLYTPYLLWPALRDRASGFLVPGIGYSSSRGGFLGLSYFQVLGRSADATITTDLYTKEYFGLGTELRLRPTAGTAFTGSFYTVVDPDRRWQWKTWGTLSADDLAPRTRAVVNWTDFSDLAFFQRYDRDFALTSARTVGQKAFVTRSEGPVAFNLRLERETALYGSSEVVLERKPVLEARLRPTGLFGNALFVEAQGSAGFLRSIRPAGQPAGDYERLDVYPKLSAPLSPVPWLSVNAEAGYRVTRYGASVSADGRSLTEEPYTRGSATAGLEVTGPSFSRVFDVKLGKFRKLKHVLEPRADYSYQTDPEDLSEPGLRRGRHDPPVAPGALLARPAAPREGGEGGVPRDRLVRALANALFRASRRSRHDRPRLASRRDPARQRGLRPQLRRPGDVGPEGGRRHLLERVGERRLGRALPPALLLRQPPRRGAEPLDAAPLRRRLLDPAEEAASRRGGELRRRAREDARVAEPRDLGGVVLQDPRRVPRPADRRDPDTRLPHRPQPEEHRELPRLHRAGGKLTRSPRPAPRRAAE
jgi:Organic solvent tolerance protein OstA